MPLGLCIDGRLAFLTLPEIREFGCMSLDLSDEGFKLQGPCIVRPIQVLGPIQGPQNCDCARSCGPWALRVILRLCQKLRIRSFCYRAKKTARNGVFGNFLLKLVNKGPKPQNFEISKIMQTFQFLSLEAAILKA